MTRPAILALFFLAPLLPADPPCTSPSIEKPYCVANVLLVPKEKATTVPDWKLREIEINRVPTGPALEFVEEKRYVTELTLQAREVEQQVVVIDSRPVTVTCPKTGKCYTEYQPYEGVKTVKVKVQEVVPVQREIVLRVPVLKPGPEAVVKRLQLDKTTAPAIEHRFDGLATSDKGIYSVPLPVVLPPCPIRYAK